MSLHDAIDYAVSGYLHPVPMAVSFALAGAAIVKGIKQYKKAQARAARLPKIEPVNLPGPR